MRNASGRIIPFKYHISRRDCESVRWDASMPIIQSWYIKSNTNKSPTKKAGDLFCLRAWHKFIWNEFGQPKVARRVKYRDVFHQWPTIDNPLPGDYEKAPDVFTSGALNKSLAVTYFHSVHPCTEPSGRTSSVQISFPADLFWLWIALCREGQDVRERPHGSMQK